MRHDSSLRMLCLAALVLQPWLVPGAGRAASAASGSGNGYGIIVRSSSGVRVYHNTILQASHTGLYFGWSRENDLPRDLDILIKVLDGAANDLGFDLEPGQVKGLTADYNHYGRGRVTNGSLDAWLSKGFERHPTQGDPLIDGAGRPRTGRPLIDGGAQREPTFVGSAPDSGWSERN